MTGDLMGTLRYMSPEQALGRRVAIDHHTDIYSLGATLFELLTLEPVFDGRDRQELLRQIAFEEPKPLRRLNKAVPAELETIVLKALEKIPAERYATAQALADDLGRFLKDESILAKRPSLPQRARKLARRHPGVVRTALVAVALLLVTIAASASLAAWRLKKERNATRDQLRLTKHAQEQSMHRLYDARLAQARAGSLSRRVGQRFDSLCAVAQAAQDRPNHQAGRRACCWNFAMRPSPAWRCPICGSPRNGPIGPIPGASISTAPWSATPAWTGKESYIFTAWPTVS